MEPQRKPLRSPSTDKTNPHPSSLIAPLPLARSASAPVISSLSPSPLINSRVCSPLISASPTTPRSLSSHPQLISSPARIFQQPVPSSAPQPPLASSPPPGTPTLHCQTVMAPLPTSTSRSKPARRLKPQPLISSPPHSTRTNSPLP